MKKYLLLFAVIATALFAQPAVPQKAPAKDAEITELVGEGQTDYADFNRVVRRLDETKKSLDDLKAQLATATQQQAGLQQANQYLSVLAERNEMAVRLLQANARSDDLQKQLDAERAKSSLLQKQIDDAKPVVKPKP